MKKGILTLALAAMALAPMTASAAFRGGIVVGGPAFYGGGFTARSGAAIGVPAGQARTTLIQTRVN